MGKLNLTDADFRLAAAAKLYDNPDGRHFDKTKLKKLLDALCRQKGLRSSAGTFCIKAEPHPLIADLEMTVLCFPFKKAVSFLPLTELKETRYAYFIMADFGRYIAISKKHLTLPASPEIQDWRPISSEKLTKAFTHDGSSIEHMVSTNLSAGENVVHKRSASANHLETALPITAHHSHVLNEVTVFSKSTPGDEAVAASTGPTSATRTKLSFSQSSIRQYGTAKALNSFWEWAQQTIQALAAADARKASPFFLNFAQDVGDTCKPKDLTPSSVLLMWDMLRRLPELRLSSGEEQLTDFFLAKSRPYEIIELNEDSVLSAKWKRTRFDLGIPCLEGVQLDWKEEKGLSLPEYINREQCFLLAFSDANYRYYQGSLYHNSLLLNNVERFKKLFKAHEELKSVTSEKGPKNLPPKETAARTAITSFEEGSIFHFVEKTFADGFDLFFCDDMGNELSDHIGLSPNKTAFYISKYAKKGGFSVSAVQEIIAQAQKNIPHFTPHEQLQEQKIAAFSNFWQGTGISKTRRNRYNYTTDEIKALWQSNINTPGATKELHLVTNIITKAIVDKRLEQVSTPGSRISAAQRCYTLQFLWLLGALFNTCLEQGIQLTIHCR